MAEGGGGEFYVAAYAFEAENDAELALKEGDVIQVFRKEGDWWEGQLQDGRLGLFPANRVVPYADESTAAAPAGYEAKMYAEGGAQYAAYDPAAAAHYAQAGYDHKMAQDAYAAQVQQYYAAMQAQQEAAAAAGAAQAPRGGGGKGAADKGAADKAGGGGDKGKGGGDKGKGGARDSGGPRKPTSRTKYGQWASNMAVLTALFHVLLGLGGIIWGVKMPDSHVGGLASVLAGLYSIILGVGMYVYERNWGRSRTADKCPTRALVYLALSIFLYFSIPTVFGAVFQLCVVAANFMSTWAGEEYEAPPEPAAGERAVDDSKQNLGCHERILAWLRLTQQQNKGGIMTFMVLYALGNIILFFVALGQWVEKNNSFPPGKKLSGWAPLAKAFGNTLDLNCAIIVVPVLRSIIRWLYNRSTANEQCFARTLRAILAFVPLDKNLAFHKLIAKVMAIQSIGHTVMHLFNYVNAPTVTMDRFGVSPWVTGGIVYVCMLFMYGAAFPDVKMGQFEVFWYSHHLFILFFFFLLVHGAGFRNPNFWKWFLLPGMLYIIERLLRMYRARQDVVLLSVTDMKPNVFSLEFAKEGVLQYEYKEGQYVFLCCPAISKVQWHPFTISSAPQEKTVTVHIKKQGPGSWTRELANYVSKMGPKDATYFELTRQGPGGLLPGKIMGPDGNPLFQIDGPHSAPTQHVSEYHTVMICGAGIGVTPVASTLKSVVLHRWKYYMGHCFPDNAYFFWVCAHNDIDSFRWLMRFIKDCEDEMFDMRAKNAKDMNQKRFEFHVYVTSVPNDAKPVEVVVDDEIGFWGVPREDRHLDKVRAPFNEEDIYRTMMCPAAHTQLGDLHIWKGRPQWDQRFQAVAAAHPRGDIGVAFCGNPQISRDLREMCAKYSDVDAGRIFKLHKENF